MTYKNTALLKCTAHLYRKLKVLWTDYSSYPQKEFYKLLLLKADVAFAVFPQATVVSVSHQYPLIGIPKKSKIARINLNEKIGSHQISQIKSIHSPCYYFMWFFIILNEFLVSANFSSQSNIQSIMYFPFKRESSLQPAKKQP